MSLDELLSGLSQTAAAIQAFAIALVASVVGLYLIINAINRIFKWHDQRRQYGLNSILVRFVVGSLLISARWTLNSAVTTFTGDGFTETGPFALYQSGSTPTTKIVGAVLAWFAALGVVAVFRGLLLWVKAADNGGGGGSDRDPMWVGSIYVVAGAIGINLWRYVTPYL